jgi:hypothetical protein
MFNLSDDICRCRDADCLKNTNCARYKFRMHSGSGYVSITDTFIKDGVCEQYIPMREDD